MKAVYFFDKGDYKRRKLLGGKGAGLCEMTQLKLPVPPGFVITTDICKRYYKNGKRLPKDVMIQVKKSIIKMERMTGKQWNSKENPLLVSVRSGAAISMPGMMDTILNLGLNDNTVEGLSSKSNNARFAWDSYRRFVQLFGKVVFGIDDVLFDKVLEDAKKRQSVQTDSELDELSLKSIVKQYKEICNKHAGRIFPSNPFEQLELAIKAVFDSWMGQRAVVYRDKNKITEHVADGTAVNVVAMVFGNMGDDSATGVVFTRNPGDGTKQIFGEYLVNAQGEDVVAGIRTPKPVDFMKTEMPESFELLHKTCQRLERHYHEPQDIEFTIEQGRFYLLQTRAAKMNATGMIKTSVDMVKERLIDKKRALLRLQPEQLEQLLHKTIDGTKVKDYAAIATGIAASPGAANGIAVFDVKRAVMMGENGAKVILIREETKPEDVPAFFASVGILTSRGGKTSHAAVVARGMGRPCIVGCSNLKIDYKNRIAHVDGRLINEGDPITIDGSDGTIFDGHVPTVEPKITDDFRMVLEWAQKTKKLGIRANADTPEAARLALEYGAMGIGLCRTERMFNGRDRIGMFVDMIMADTTEQRKIVLEKLGQLQKSDFIEILKIMAGHKVTIRLLDPPLHEFLPNPEELADKLRKLEEFGETKDVEKTRMMLRRARDLAEINPMMGHRGVRVGITYPEIYEMQIRAVFEATAELAGQKINVQPQIMVPQVSSVSELNQIKKIYDRIKNEVQTEHNQRFTIDFGTMLEVVRACLVADNIAQTAEFFSFGTNDLTQGTFSFSREDAEEKFLPEYFNKDLLKTNPFQSIDVDGLGSLIEIALERGRSVKKNIEVGICGEHGGDPSSIKFCHEKKLSYVSASPHRIPIAIIAAAQVELDKPNIHKRQNKKAGRVRVRRLSTSAYTKRVKKRR